MYSNKVLVAYFLFRFLTDRCCYTFMVSGQYSGCQTIQRYILGLEFPLIIVRIFSESSPSMVMYTLWYLHVQLLPLFQSIYCVAHAKNATTHFCLIRNLSFKYLSQISRIHSVLLILMDIQMSTLDKYNH